MNIIIINHYAGGPFLGMEFRPYYLAKEWKKTGNNVTIIGASYSHLRNNQPSVKRDLSIEQDNETAYVWIKTPSYKNNIFRILNILTFVIKLIIYRKKIANKYKPDIVIASSTYPLDIFPSYFIARIAKSKLVYEVHDLWPLSPMIIGGYSKRHPYILLMQWAENFAYSHSDQVVSLLGNSKNYMREHGLDPVKFIHIPNGFDKDEFDTMHDSIPEEHLQIISRLKKDGNILIGYAGGLAPSNAMNVLLDAARLLQSDINIKFIIVGNGPLKTDLQNQAGNLQNVYFLNPVSKRAIPDLLKHFDILYAGGIKSDLHLFGISFNKLTDYMLASKPIVLSANVENEIVERCNCGITVPAGDHYAVSSAIKNIVNMTECERDEMGKRGQIFAFSELDYKILAARFIKY